MSSNSWRDNSSGRTARPPLARNDRSSSRSSIPKPPAPPEQESSSVTQPPPLPAATRGELRYPIPHFNGEYIELFTRDETKDFYKVVRAKSLPAKCELLSEKDLQRVLNKASADISQHDKDMADYIIDRIDDASRQASDYVIEIMVDTTKRYVNIRNEAYIDRVAVRDVKNLYSLLPTSMIKLVGNYYSVLRQRPYAQGRLTRYEYMPNGKYSYRVVKRNLAQLDIEVLPSRMWVETVFQNTTDPQMHPYIEWCSGLTLDLPEMEATIGLSHIPYGTELVNREAKPNAKPRTDFFASVQNFVTQGLIQDDTKQSLLAFKAVVDEQINIAKEAKEDNHFMLPERIIQMFINRWYKISKALQTVSQPHKVYGDNVFNLPPEAADNKRKDRDPSSSTTPCGDDEEKGIIQQAGANNDVNMEDNDDDNDVDRQSLQGGGGNPK